VSLLAVFAVSAVASASASAASEDVWEVCQEKAGAGTEPPIKYDNHLCNTKEKALSLRKWEWKTIAAGEKFAVESTGGAFKLEGGGNSSDCTAVTNTGELEPGGKSKTSLVFTGCTNDSGKCEEFAPAANDGTGTIDVSGITDQLVERGGKLADEFKENATTHEFVTIELEVPGTEACAEAPTTKVKGQVAGESNNITVAGQGETELVFPKPALVGNSLEGFGVKASLFGTATVSLVNKWSVRATKGPPAPPACKVKKAKWVFCSGGDVVGAESNDQILKAANGNPTTFKSTAGGVAIEITCTKGTLKTTLEFEVVSSGGQVTGPDTFESCTMPVPLPAGSCTIKAGKIATEPITGGLEGPLAGPPELKLGAVGTKLSVVEIETCAALKGKYILTGEQKCTVDAAYETEQAEHEIKCSEAGSNLKLEKEGSGENEATKLAMTAKGPVESGAKWSIQLN